MSFLAQFLPIVIYSLLIVAIIVGIVLGIKLIITIDKALKIIDNINEKVEKITPLVNTLELVSNKFSDVVNTVIRTTESVIFKLLKKRRKETESGKDE